MIEFHDDFGELYADIDVPAVNSSQIDRANTVDCSSDDSSDDRRSRLNDVGIMTEDAVAIAVEVENEVEDEDDDDDDFVVVVNDDDDEGEEEKKKEKTEGNVGFEANVVGNGGGGKMAKFNGGNSQYKYIRRSGSVPMDMQRATRSGRVDKDDIGRSQQKSSCGRFEQAYAGSNALGLGDLGNGLCLPRYRTIVDVDIDTLEQKPWTHSGADMTDYFNFGFDQDSWRSYCQSLDQLRRQSFIQAKNQGYGSLRSCLAGANKELESDEFAAREFDASGHRNISSQELMLSNNHIGQAIHVEESNTERQPSMNFKPPRIFDSDVVIEITLQEPEEPSDSLKEQDGKLEPKFENLEKGCEQGKLAQETQISEDLKANEPRQFCVKENVCSPTPSNLRRSYESLTVSTTPEKSCTQTERQNSESGMQNSGKVDTFSGGNPRAQNIVKDDTSSDRDSTATNPCVAGLDLLSDDDHIQSSETSSYSHSEGLNNDYHNDPRKTRNSRKSSPDSVVGRNQVVRVDYHGSRDSKRDSTERKGRFHKHHSRVRRSTEECLKSNQKNFWRHSEMRSHTCVDNDYDIDAPNHVLPSGRSRFLHRDEEWRHTSNFIDEDGARYKEKSSFLKCYDRHFAEDELYTKCEEDSHRQDHWDFRDDISLSMRRRWDDEQCYSERKRQTRDDIGHRDWNLEEKELLYRKENHRRQNEPHSISNYDSSANINWQCKDRDYHDDHLKKRSKHVPLVKYRYSDMSNRYGDSPLDDWQGEYVDTKIEHRRHLKHFEREARTFDRGDDFFEHPSSDINHPWFIREDYEYHNDKVFPSILDEQPVYTERWRHSSLSRDEADLHQTCNRYGRNGSYRSAKKSRNVAQPFDNGNTFEREDSRVYLDQDGHFESRRYIFQSDWQDNALHEANIKDDVHEKLYLNGIPRHKLIGAKNGLVSIHTQGMKDGYAVVSDANKRYDKTSKIPTRYKHEGTGLRFRNPKGLHDFRGEKLYGSKNPGSAPNNDARLHVRSFEKQQILDASVSDKSMVNEALKVEGSQAILSITTHCDLEDGQIPTEDLNAKETDSAGLAQKDGLKQPNTRSSQKLVNQNGNCAYDESRILATKAKMDKRRERFKEPILVNKVVDSDPSPQAVKPGEATEFKGQRPTRKRRWGGI
ncbi:hypothetical protein vseg_012016 [Gypsophila vaccaria]